MIHYGDITKISGYDVPIVDCVVGGSPCQNLSVAGKREGLDGDESKLFVEMIRIIKEMRDCDARSGRSGEFIRPRFAVWENVPGAFSSNKGQDFKAVLESFAQIVEEDASIPMPPKDKWTTSGCIVGDGWSIAWRVLDAQFWGVPQRRRRIALVADFGGGCAQEILFERKGLRRDSEESRTERQSPSTDAQGCIGVYDRDGKTYGFPLGFRPENVRCYEEKATTLCIGTRAGFCNGVITCYDIGDRRREPNEFEDVSPTLLSKMGTGGNNVPVVVEGLDVYNQQMTGEKTMTLTCRATDSHHIPCVVMDRSAYNQGENAKFNIGIDEDGVAFSHIAKGPGAVCYCLQGNQIDQADTSVCNGSGFKEGTSYTLNVRDRHAVVYNGEKEGMECGETDYTEGIKALQVLWEAYGKETIFQWLSSILERIQQAEVLQSGVYERSIQSETTQGNELDDNSLPCPKHIAEWVLRDMWESRECGCSSQGWESTEQQEGESSKAMSELSYQATQSCREMLDMWQKGEGIWLLRQALSTIQKMGKSSCSKEKQPRYIVRRLTPLEAERLQGYPDGWTDIGEYTDSKGKKKKTSDTARYKALGNSIALPPWKWIIKRLCSHYERDATMASLFDGIGGFPCIWEQINGKGTALWASEIEDFPIAVTKVRIE